MMVIGLDDPVPQKAMDEIRALSHIANARLANADRVTADPHNRQALPAR